MYFLDILKARTFYNENVYLEKGAKNKEKKIGLERKSSFSVIFLSLEFNVWRKRGWDRPRMHKLGLAIRALFKGQQLSEINIIFT